MLIAIAYIMLLYLLFTVYMVFAVRRYGRWLNDNYADLENKKVWLCQVVTLASLLLFMLYTLVDIDTTLMMFLLHFTELVLFGLLLWRVETLPQLEETLPPTPPCEGGEQSDSSAGTSDKTIYSPPSQGGAGGESGESASPITIDLSRIERLLSKHCVDTQLYLQHDLTLQQLAQTIGTNRSYLSQHFSRQGITYNTYINNLRINHFISRYQKLAAAGQPIVAQQLASESGFRSYSTFSLAFKQRTGQTVTAWMHDTGGVIV